MIATAPIRAAFAVGVALVALGCTVVTQQLVIGEWRCAGATTHAIDSLTTYSWGELTITRADGQGARGVYHVDGSTLTAYGIWWAADESEAYSISGGQITGPGREICTKIG